MKNIESGIYCIEHIECGKKYIGKSVDVKRRLREHSSRLDNNRDTKYLQNAWNKYGRDAFKFYIIELCPTNKLLDLEIFYIKTLKSHYTLNGFNISLGGESGLCGVNGKDHPWYGRKHTAEEIKKMSKPRSDAAKANMRWDKPSDFGKKMSKINKGKPCKNKGTPLSEETKKRLLERFGSIEYAWAKLNQEDVIEIRKMISNGIPIAQIAREYSVVYKTIRNIRDGISWRNVK